MLHRNIQASDSSVICMISRNIKEISEKVPCLSTHCFYVMGSAGGSPLSDIGTAAGWGTPPHLCLGPQRGCERHLSSLHCHRAVSQPAEPNNLSITEHFTISSHRVCRGVRSTANVMKSLPYSISVHMYSYLLL